MMNKMEKIVFANLEKQSTLVNKTFKEMGVVITQFLEGHEDFQKSVLKIKNYEKESNKLRHKNLETVAQAVGSISRSDLLRLVMKMSDVMSNQAGASVRLGHVKFTPAPNDGMIPRFKALIETFVKMGEALRNLMRNLGENMEKAQESCNKIDELEEEVDQLYRDLHGHLYNRINIPLRIVMQLLSVSKHIEEACDHCASVADSVRIILATH